MIMGVFISLGFGDAQRRRADDAADKAGSIFGKKTFATYENAFGEISKDKAHGLSDDVQKMTDTHIARIEDIVKAKEAEIMQV